MKQILKTFLTAASLLTAGTASLYATCTTSAGDTCQTPAAATQSALTINAASILGIQAINSATGTGNPTNSNYFFAVTTTNNGATIGTINNSGDGTTVVGVTPTHPASSSPGSTVTAGSVQGTKGGTTYWVYAQACPPGTSANGTNCSQWAKVDTSQVTTTSYPGTVFSAPTKPTDTTVNTIAARTNVPSGDQANVSAIDLTIDDLITPANDMAINPISYSGNSSPYIIDGNTMFTNGFKPNNKYQYTGQVQYPWDLVPTLGPQTVGPFWTKPENPGTVTASNVTHCSAQITAQNSNVSTSNPTYTEYSLCAGAVCQTSGRIGGTPVPSDTVVQTITGLNPGTAYTPNATALVGNQDGSQTGWGNSGTTNGTGFTTLTWGGTFTVGTITTNSAVFTISGLTGAGSIASWIIFVNGVNTLSGTGDPTGDHALSGLNANTSYNVTIQLTETSGCSSTLPVGGVGFFTLPVAPTTPAGFTATTANSITATWTDASTNASGTTYDLQYSAVGSGGPWTNFATHPTKAGSGTTETGTITGLNPFTSYWVQVKTISASGNAANDSAFLVIGSTQTKDTSVNMSAITFNVYTSSISLAVTASGGIAPYQYHWSVSPSAGTSFTSNDTMSTPNNTVMNFTSLTSYTISVTATDNSGVGPGVGNQQVVINPGQVPTTITIAPTAATVVTGNGQAFTATVKDQFGVVITNQAVNWIVNGGGTLTSANGASTTFNATTPGSFTLTASLSPAPPATAPLTVLAAGPVVDSLNFVLSPDSKGGTVTVTGHDNVAHHINHSWSSDPSVTFTPSTGQSNDGVAYPTAVQFTKAGTFTLTDSLGSGVSTGTVVNVPQVLTSLKVCPANDTSCPSSITVQTFQLQQFTATGVDQFGNTMPVGSITWSANGGNVSGAGAFSASTLGQNIVVTATSGGKSGSITVAAISFDVSGAYAYPVPYKASSGRGSITFTGLGSQANIRIYTASGRKVFTLDNWTGNVFDWNIKNSSGENLASGVYFYVIESPSGKKDGKLIIIQ